MRKTAIAAYAVMDSGPAMIRRIKALDASKQTFRCCTLTAEKNSEDMAITPGRIAFAAILKKKGGHCGYGMRDIHIQLRQRADALPACGGGCAQSSGTACHLPVAMQDRQAGCSEARKVYQGYEQGKLGHAAGSIRG